LGSLAAAPLALRLGRRRMYVVYFLWSAISIALAFALPLEPSLRLMIFGLVGVSVYGIFATFNLSAGALPNSSARERRGFGWNAGDSSPCRDRSSWAPSLQSGAGTIDILQWIAIIPAIGLVLLAIGVGARRAASDSPDRDLRARRAEPVGSRGGARMPLRGRSRPRREQGHSRGDAPQVVDTFIAQQKPGPRTSPLWTVSARPSSSSISKTPRRSR
jgi:hypothetical protein